MVAQQKEEEPSDMRVLVGVLMALALASLGGCGADRAQPPNVIRIGVLRLPSSGPVFIAVDRGYFREDGLTPELQWFDAAAAVPVAVVSGDLDVGITGLTAAAFNLAARDGIRIIASQTREEPGFKMTAFVATRRAYEHGYTSVRASAGRRIGVTTFGSTMHYNFALIARKYGFSLASITFVPLQTLQNLQAALVGGQIDGALFPAAQSRRLEASGAVRILAWAGDEVPWQLGAVFTHPQEIQSRRPMLERFVRAYRKGARAYHEAFNTRDAAGQVVRGRDYDALIAIVARYTNQTPAQLQDAMPFMDADARIDVESFYDQVRFWQQAHMVVRSADPKPMFDLSFIDGHVNVPR
jgi:NitT/TauT family transport system substrate-binding protein